MATRAAKTETTYEIYVLEGKRWQLHARYRSHERDSAMAEARDLDRQKDTHGVKVVREIFYPDYNKTEEAVIYVGQTALRQGRIGSDDLEELGLYSPGMEGNPSPSGIYIAWRIIVITVFSLGFGVLAALATSVIMGYLASLGINTQTSSRTIVFIVFILGVVVVALPMLISLVMQLSHGHAEEKPKPRPKPRPKPKPKSKSEPEALSFTEDHGFSFDNMKEEDSSSRGFSIESFDAFDEPADEKAPWWKFSWFANRAREAEKQSLLFPGADEPPLAPQPGEDPAFSVPEEPEPEPETAPPPLDEEPAEAVDFEEQRLFVMRFLGGAISAIKSVRPQLDAHTKFAFDLALAGGCEVVAERSGLGERDKRAILREAVEMIGTKPELAQTFADKYETYFAEARYKQMAELGREAMQRFLGGQEQPFAALPFAIENWDKPQINMAAQQSITTIFFTDMVGSTDLTQEKGDFAAQEIVRRHNAIVRSALAEHGGREIKHTGDGIMAICPSAASAMQACIDIQRAIASFNATAPMIPLEVRIGINAGEMIAEENDVFGAAVQLAARICAAAKARQILASQAVRDLAASRAEGFVSLGAVALKGFKEPVQIYEIPWQGAAGPSEPMAVSQPLPG